MAKVRVGLVGCGFAAELHMHGYRRVYGVDAQVTAVAARGDHVVDFAKRHRIPTTYRDLRALLASKAELEENRDVKPFFESHPHLCALLGMHSPEIIRCDLLTYQYQLFRVADPSAVQLLRLGDMVRMRGLSR